MDKRLTEELDQRFARNLLQIEEKFADTHSRIDDNSRRIEENGRRIEENGRRIEENSRRIDENSRRIEEFRLETIQRFDATDERLDRLDARIDRTNVVVEDLQSDVQLIAEGVTVLNQKVDRILDGLAAGRERDDQLDLRIRRLEVAQARAAIGGS